MVVYCVASTPSVGGVSDLVINRVTVWHQKVAQPVGYSVRYSNRSTLTRWKSQHNFHLKYIK